MGNEQLHEYLFLRECTPQSHVGIKSFIPIIKTGMILHKNVSLFSQ